MESNFKPEMRTLGKTGIQITPIGLGVMEFAGGSLTGSIFPKIPQEEKNHIVQVALDGGINWFDTAEIYGSGVSESSLAAALKTAGKEDKDVVVATKWFPFMRTADNIRRTIDDRLRLLNGFSVSLFMIHQPWGLSSPEAEMDAMADLVEAGKIRSVGVSNFNPERMRRAHHQLAQRGLPLAVNQVHYSLFNRQIETNGVLDTAKELGVTIIAYTPLEFGLLTGKYHKNPELLKQKPFYRRRPLERNLERTRRLIAAMEKIAAKYDATLSQVALNWLIHFQGEIVVTIPGATKTHQAQENTRALKFKLSKEELEKLSEISQKLMVE